MKKVVSLFGIILIATSCHKLPENQISMVSSNVIYGTNDLVSAHNAPRNRQLIGRSVAIRMKKSNIAQTTVDGVVQLSRFGTIREITQSAQTPYCSGEPLVDEKKFGNCTGFLIGKDLLMTASHCLGGEEQDQCIAKKSCPDTSWAFGVTSDKISGLPVSEIYNCKKILYFDGDADYAIIQLDRERTSSPILKLSPARAANFSGMYSFNYPLGTTLKYTDKIELISDEDFYDYDFRVTGEFYHGASGAPIFNSNDEVVAVLLTGKDDFVKKANENCMTANYEVKENGGENAMYINDHFNGLTQYDWVNYEAEELRRCGR